MMSDHSKGIISKYYGLKRYDGKSVTPYWVLEYTKDPHAIKALKAYAESVSEEYPELASDLDKLVAEYGDSHE